MNQLDRCKYININYAPGKMRDAVIWIAIALWRLNRGLFSFLGKQIQQTTTRTKSSARGIQNKQFTEVRHCWRGTGGLNIELGADYPSSCLPLDFLSADEMAELHFVWLQDSMEGGQSTEKFSEKKRHISSHFMRTYISITLATKRTSWLSKACLIQSYVGNSGWRNN